MVLHRVEFAYNVSVHESTLLYYLHLKWCVDDSEYILDPETILDWDDSERLCASQISNKSERL